MQRFTFFFISCCSLFAMSGLLAQSTWKHADVAATDSVEQAPDIAVEADGTAHIVFRKETFRNESVRGYDMFYANTRGGTLSAPERITFLEADVWPGSIALDPWGNVHIALENNSLGQNNTVVYLNNVGGSFSTPEVLVGPHSTQVDWPLEVFLDVDSEGFAHIVYFDEVEGVNHIYYGNNDNAANSLEVTDLGNFGFDQGAQQPRIDERNGVVHIAFVSGSTTPSQTLNRDIYYVNNAGGSFGTPILVADIDDCDEHPSISVEEDGTVHIMHDICTIGGVFHSVSNSSGEFDTEQVLEPGFWAPDLALGPNNEVGIAATPNDPANNVPQDGILFLTNQGGSWNSEVIIAPGAVEDVVEFGAWFGHGIAIDGDGYVHVAGRQTIYTRKRKGKKKIVIVNVDTNVRYHTNNPNFSPGGPPPSGGTMHVENIDMSTEPANGNRWKAVADVLIHDDQGQPVSGASVTGSWSGLVSGSSTATTGSSGVATLKSPKTQKSGKITFTVDNLAKDGFNYNSGANVETSDSITGPPAAKFFAGESEAGLPSEFALLGNYPNPFNPETAIRFALPEASHVEITIYNVRGQTIRQLVSNDFVAGEQTVKWDGKDDIGSPVSSGVYLYQLQAGDFFQVKKMSLLR